MLQKVDEFWYVDALSVRLKPQQSVLLCNRCDNCRGFDVNVLRVHFDVLVQIAVLSGNHCPMSEHYLIQVANHLALADCLPHLGPEVSHGQ